MHQRNVTVFADGQIDRSPVRLGDGGSGTAARLALLASDGRLDVGERLLRDSIVGTRFLGTIVERATVAGRDAVVGEVAGTAFRTGEHRLLLDPDDDLGEGFVLRWVAPGSAGRDRSGSGIAVQAAACPLGCRLSWTL